MPDQLWSLTLNEFVLQIEGYAWREEQAQWRNAALIAAIYDVNRNRKKRRKPITAEDIMGRQRGQRTRMASDPAEQLQVLIRVTRAMGGTIRRAPRAR